MNGNQSGQQLEREAVQDFLQRKLFCADPIVEHHEMPTVRRLIDTIDFSAHSQPRAARRADLQRRSRPFGCVAESNGRPRGPEITALHDLNLRQQNITDGLMDAL